MGKKIILLHYAAPPIVGGVESVLAHHARLMADAGHRVTIVAGRGAQFDDRVPFVHVPLVDSRHPDVLSVKESLDEGLVPAAFSDLSEAIYRKLKSVVMGFDFLIAHNVCSLAKNLPLTAALKQLSEDDDTPRIVLWHHDLAWTTPRYQNELHSGYPWDLLRVDWPKVDQVVVSNLRQQELSDLMGVQTERIRVVPNGVDATIYLKLEDQTRRFISQLDLLSADLLLLLPVRITPRKNIELAIRVLSALMEYYQDARLVITGPLGPHNPANVAYFQRLKDLRTELNLTESIHFLADMVQEFLPDQVIADFYHLADALLLPSREEGFGIPILEAGLAGIPIFCTDIKPLQALGDHWATYFSPDDKPELVAALIQRRMDEEPTYGMRLRVRTKYTWEQTYQEHIDPLLNQ